MKKHLYGLMSVNREDNLSVKFSISYTSNNNYAVSVSLQNDDYQTFIKNNSKVKPKIIKYHSLEDLLFLER